MFGYKKLKQDVELGIKLQYSIDEGIRILHKSNLEKVLTKLEEMTATEQQVKDDIRAKGYEQIMKMDIPSNHKEAVKAMIESITR